jgi:hypothetical protein
MNLLKSVRMVTSPFVVLVLITLKELEISDGVPKVPPKRRGGYIINGAR